MMKVTFGMINGLISCGNNLFLAIFSIYRLKKAQLIYLYLINVLILPDVLDRTNFLY